ncbi:hypothetical protein [Lysinibacillus sp. FSL M8-0355]|uniref:hypothetical protein n=1 Tax=Lysinibacillus sp. FSL M8-0355 TaxID=2921719 RepID=UPI0030FA7079
MTKVAAATSKSAQRLLEFQQNNGYLNDVRLESFGFFLDDYVIYGGNLTFDTVDVYKILLDESIVSLNDQLWRAFIKEFRITKYNTTYYVGFLDEKGYVFGETEPFENYMRLWTIPVDANGIIGVPVDHRNLYGYLKLKAKYDGVYLNVDEVHEAITNANSAADKANQAASDVQSAVDAAQRAAYEAQEAVIATERAIENVNSSLNQIDQAIEAVNVVIDESNTATESANQAVRDINIVKEDLSSTVTEKLNEADIAIANTIEAADIAVTNAVEATEVAIVNAVEATDTANQASEAIKGWGNKRQWNNTTVYEKNNIVTFNGSTWQAVRENQGVVPTEGEDWSCLAQKGIDGTGAVSSVNGKYPDENGNVELELQQDAVQKVNGKSPDATGAVTLDASDVGAYTESETDTHIQNLKDVLEASGYAASDLKNITETEYSQMAVSGQFYVTADNSAFLPTQEPYFGSVYLNEDSFNTLKLLEVVKISSGITYTRVITHDGTTNIADTGWIEGGGGSDGSGGGITNINPLKLATTTENQKSWNIPNGNYDPSTDSLLVFHNGVYLPTLSWSVTGVAPNYVLNIPDNPMVAITDNNVSIAIFSNMPFGPTETITGTRITPLTIGMDRLEQSVQDLINSGGAEIVNNLTTDDANKVLSAAMGVEIKRQIDAVPTTYFSTSLTLDDETKAATSKAVKQLNDEKFNKSGGTMSGSLIIDKSVPDITLQSSALDGTKKKFVIRTLTTPSNNEVEANMLVNGNVALRILGNKNVQFMDNSNVWTSLQDLKQSVVDGKTKVSAAITTKGVNTAADATFDTLATNINAIPSGKKYLAGNIVSTVGSMTAFNYADGTNAGLQYFVELTLPFEAEIIVLTSFNNISVQSMSVLIKESDGNSPNIVKMSAYNANASGGKTNMNFRAYTSISASSSTYRIPIYSDGLTYRFKAYSV